MSHLANESWSSGSSSARPSTDSRYASEGEYNSSSMVSTSNAYSSSRAGYAPSSSAVIPRRYSTSDIFSPSSHAPLGSDAEESFDYEFPGDEAKRRQHPDGRHRRRLGLSSRLSSIYQSFARPSPASATGTPLPSKSNFSPSASDTGYRSSSQDGSTRVNKFLTDDRSIHNENVKGIAKLGGMIGGGIESHNEDTRSITAMIDEYEEESRKEHIDYMRSLKDKYGYDPSNVSAIEPSLRAPSVFSHNEEDEENDSASEYDPSNYMSSTQNAQSEAPDISRADKSEESPEMVAWNKQQREKTERWRQEDEEYEARTRREHEEQMARWDYLISLVSS